MKKLFYLAFVAVVALSFGCAITNYPVITDNEDDGNFVVNTAGQSSIKPGSGITVYSGSTYGSFLMAIMLTPGRGS